MICVYEPTCTDFSNNGLGAVSPQSCSVTETLNGEWELTLVHPIDDLGKWQRLTEGCILRAPVPAAMTPQINLVTQNYQTDTYDVEIYKITTKSSPLRLRSGTGTNYKILGKYKKGKEVIVLDKTTSDWYEVTAPDGKHGYVNIMGVIVTIVTTAITVFLLKNLTLAMVSMVANQMFRCIYAEYVLSKEIRIRYLKDTIFEVTLRLHRRKKIRKNAKATGAYEGISGFLVKSC